MDISYRKQEWEYVFQFRVDLRTFIKSDLNIIRYRYRIQFKTGIGQQISMTSKYEISEIFKLKHVERLTKGTSSLCALKPCTFFFLNKALKRGK